MPDILKDRNYYRMLSDRELREEAERTGNELAITLLRRHERSPGYNKDWRFA